MSATPARILTIEDEPMVREILTAYMEDSGFEVIQAGDGRTGIGLIRSEQPDLVLCDLRMPGMDGLEATRLLRHPSSDVLNPAIPVIALTAHAVEGYREICRQAGMNDYVTKPITMKQIRRILDNWLPKETP